MAVQVSVSPVGALVGGLLGALIRPAILYACIGQLKGDESQIVFLISALIGFGVGAVAGLLGQPVLSAVVGGLLGGFMYMISMIPLMFCLCLSSLENQKGGGSLPPMLAIAFSGVLSGGLGGTAEWLLRRQKHNLPQAQPGHPPASKPGVWEPDDADVTDPPLPPSLP